MFRFGKVAWFSSGGYAPFMDAPDAGTGGGGTDPVDGGDGLPPSDGNIDAASGNQPPAATDDEDDDDDDLKADGDWTPERGKRVAKKLSKQNRRVQRLTAAEREYAPIRAQLAELREQGITLDDLRHGHRQYRELSQQIAANPHLRKLVSGDVADEETRAAAAPAREEEPDPDFDPKSLPFDPENEENKFAFGLAQDNHELKRLAKQLQKRLDAIEGKDTARTQEEAKRVEAKELKTWKDVIDAAAATVPEDFRYAFMDAMTSAYQDRKRHGKPATFFIAHYLKGKLAPGQQRTANTAAEKAADKAAKPATPATTPVRTAATQQRIAESNKNLPRTVGPVGTPSTARTQKESLADVRRRITGSKSRY